MANHRIYRYTSLARPPNPAGRAGKVVLYLLPAAALLGVVMGWLRTASLGGVAEYAAVFTLVLYGAWALARELDPDDSPVSFISMALGLLAALLVEEPGVFIVYVTIALVRLVNRSSGLEPRHSDSVLLMLASIGVIYHSASPLFGLVAGLAFALDGSLKNARPSQWVYGLVCMGATVVYMVDHDIGLAALQAPDSLFEWIALLFILIFALDTLLMKRVRTRGDVNGLRLDIARVRSGMAVGALAALQGVTRPGEVVVIVATIAGLCIGIAFRKGFKVPPA
jgi:hypothetical protein